MKFTPLSNGKFKKYEYSHCLRASLLTLKLLPVIQNKYVQLIVALISIMLNSTTQT